MGLTERSREATEAVVAELRTEYGAVETVEKTWTHDREGYERTVERFEAGAAGGAGVWLTDDAGEVLLVRNEGDDGWADPGGKREAGESFEEAARREVREESGVDCELTGICEVHVIEHEPADADEPPLVSPIVIFHGRHAGGEPRPRDGEIAEVGWFSEPPADVLYEEVRTRPYPE